MKIIMYGSDICSDCVNAKKIFAKHPELKVVYKIITESTENLKEFLSYRDHEEIFEPIKKDGKIGIPFFILEDGTKTFDISDFIDTDCLKK